MTKTSRVLNAFLSGKVLTAKQIASRFGAGNPYEIVRTLRNDGYNIFITGYKNSKGKVTNKYHLVTETTSKELPVLKTARGSV